jgi:mono/diheme cytochrome c family protein
MKTRSIDLARRIALVSSVLIWIGAASIAAQHPPQHDAAAHHHPGAAKIKNPLPATEASIAAGEKLYVRHCSECHGATGKGDGEMGDEMDPKPADLTDAQWKHGSSDGEIFTVIRSGVKSTGMKSFAKKLTTHQTWDIVNYLRTLGPKPAKSH